jgi:hypothetical protein
MLTNERQNFLRKIDGSSITLAYLLQHLAATRVHAMLLGPESDMWEYASARRAAEGVSGVEVSVMFLLSSITSSHPTPSLPR